jgi:hypothetical protein
MAAGDEGPTFRSTEARGERAWKEETDRVASRNVATQKAGKQEREAYERSRDKTKRDNAAARDAKLTKKRRTP